MCFNQNQTRDISTLTSSSLKLANKFTYFRNSVSSTENDINMRLAKTWSAIDRLLVIWKSDLSDKIKVNFLQAAVVSILPHGCQLSVWRKSLMTIAQECYEPYWTDPQSSNCMVTYSSISKTIQVKQTRHAGHCWRSKGKFISDVLLCTPSHGQIGSSRMSITYLQQLSKDKGCSLEDLINAMDDRDE